MINKIKNKKNEPITSISRSVRIKELSKGVSFNLSSINTNAILRAPRNGYGIVYHRSDCGYPNVRSYSWGGDGSGSVCGYWVSTLKNKCDYSDADIVWYGNWNDRGNPTRMINTLYNNKINDRPQSSHNWSIDDIFNEFRCI